MINRDERCVYVADSPGNAEVLVLWLDDQGVKAQVMNPATLGGLLGLTPFSPSGVSSTGIEIWVDDPTQATLARQLIEQHEQEIAAKRERAAQTVGPITVVCEECNHENIFSGEQAGSTQDCEECGAYLDVPGPEEDDWDVGDDEEDEEGPNENITAK